jgi:tetratricopeptide (TPR) repeat protein
MIRAAVLCLLLSALPACAEPPSGAITRGLRLLSSGRVKEAVSYYRRLVEQYPNWAEAQVGLGYAFEKSGDPNLAREAYEMALRLDAKDVRAMNNLGNVLIDLDLDLPRAIRLLKRALELKPDFSAAWDNLGWALWKTKNYGEAAQNFRMALRHDPRNEAAHYHMGIAYLRQENYAKAQHQFNQVVKLDPQSSRGWMAMGLSLERMDRKPQARRSYERALALVPRQSVPGRELVRLINGLGNLEGSTASLLASDPGPARDGDLRQDPPLRAPFADMNPYSAPVNAPRIPPGTGLLGSGTPGFQPPGDLPDPRTGVVLNPGPDPAAAPPIQGLPRQQPRQDAVAPRQDPSAPPAGEVHASLVKQDLLEQHLKMALAYEQAGLFSDAVSEGQTVVNLAPWSTEAGTAKELLARLAKREEVGPDQRIFGLMKLGQTLYTDHAADAAILQFEKILLLNPSHAIAYKNLAFLNLKAGRLDVAYSQAKKAVELEPQFLEALLIKGHIEARQRHFKDSYDTFRRLAEISREGTPVRQYAEGLAQKMRRFIELD